jgi:hypothetical protein
MFDIVIPSRSRAYNQKTIHNLSEELWEKITVVVPHTQYTEYKRTLPSDITTIPFEEVDSAGEKRDFILNMKETGKIFLLDDDLTFYCRTLDGKKFPQATKAETKSMMYEISRYLDTYAMVGVTDKFMSQTKPREHMECQRCNQVLCINRDLLPKPWPKFEMAVGEEHHFHLQLLTQGYKTTVLTEWSKSDKTDAPGGCSEWRNAQNIGETFRKLEGLWPGIITINWSTSPARFRCNWQEAKRRGGIC